MTEGIGTYIDDLNGLVVSGKEHDSSDARRSKERHTQAMDEGIDALLYPPLHDNKTTLAHPPDNKKDEAGEDEPLVKYKNVYIHDVDRPSRHRRNDTLTPLHLLEDAIEGSIDHLKKLFKKTEYIHYIIFKYIKTKRSQPSVKYVKGTFQKVRDPTKQIKKTLIYLPCSKTIHTLEAPLMGWMTQQEAREWVRPPVIIRLRIPIPNFDNPHHR